MSQIDPRDLRTGLELIAEKLGNARAVIADIPPGQNGMIPLTALRTTPVHAYIEQADAAMRTLREHIGPAFTTEPCYIPSPVAPAGI